METPRGPEDSTEQQSEQAVPFPSDDAWAAQESTSRLWPPPALTSVVPLVPPLLIYWRPLKGGASPRLGSETLWSPRSLWEGQHLGPGKPYLPGAAQGGTTPGPGGCQLQHAPGEPVARHPARADMRKLHTRAYR